MKKRQAIKKIKQALFNCSSRELKKEINSKTLKIYKWGIKRFGVVWTFQYFQDCVYISRLKWRLGGNESICFH